ncbi:glycoside hydrolase family 16 protein, partial [Marasmius fiardii PR-910]
LCASAGTTYNVVQEYAGTTFFDGWDFYGSFDNLTNGDAIFVSASEATSQRLAYVDSSTNHAIIKVDNTTRVPFNQKRNTVRMTSKDRFAMGSVWVADMYHVPFGCSVWPAFWSQAPDWPAGGEIDTFEGVNQVTRNQMALHTKPGCSLRQDLSSLTQTSPIINSTNCDAAANQNSGCVVTDPSLQSYGEVFATSGGGVFVTEFAEEGISVWFFPRDLVPSSLSSNTTSLDISTIGKPTANWPSGPGGCDVQSFFQPQNLIFDITLCGDFAGAPNVFSQTCTGTCYNDYVIGDPSTYNNAYFDVASVRVYGEVGKQVVL